MINADFAKPSLEVHRENLATLFEAFEIASGIQRAVASEIVADDRAFVYRAPTKPINFTTYDRVVGRFSAIWPEDTAWPAGVPRPAPENLTDKAAAKLAEARAKIADRNERKRSVPLPGGAAWPSDIPEPGTMETANG